MPVSSCPITAPGYKTRMGPLPKNFVDYIFCNIKNDLKKQPALGQAVSR
jgi:hypothetical protein